MNIDINIFLNNDNDYDINECITACESNDHNVTLNVFDYRLRKTTVENTVVNYYSYPYEEQYNHKYHLLSQYEDRAEKPDFFVKLVDNVIPQHGFIDSLFGSHIDDNIAVVYSDYSLSNGGHIPICMYNKSMPVYSNILPLVGFSYRYFLQNIGEENPEGLLFTNLPSYHVPDSLCLLKI